jgi:CHAT domain
VADLAALTARRRAAALASDDGRLPDAERELSEVAAQLEGEAAPAARRVLIETLTERALVRQLSNQWQLALADLDRAVAMAEPLPVLLRRTVGFSALARRSKLHARPGTPVFDLAAAQRDVDAARVLGFAGWFADELDCTIAYEAADWPRVAALSPAIGAHMAQEGFAVGACFAALRSARACVELGRHDEAARELAGALPLLERHGPPDQLARALMLSARLASARGEHESALALAQRALAISESLIRQFRVLADQHRFVADKIDAYRHAFAIALAPGGAVAIARAWSIAERAKGFYLCQLVANADVALFDGVDPALPARLRELDAALDASERRLMSAGDGSIEAAAAQEVERLVAERDRLTDEAMRSNPRWASLRTPPSLDVAQLVARLVAQPATQQPAGVLLWSVFLMPAATACDFVAHVFTAVDGQIAHHVEPITAAEIQRCERIRGALEQFDGGETDLPVLANSLCERLFPLEFQRQLPGRELLIASAHGVLTQVPLHATRLADGRLLIEHVAVQFTPTLALLAQPARSMQAQSDAEPTSALLIGCEQDGFQSAPLPDVAQEIAMLAGHWRARGCPTETLLLAADESPASRGLPMARWQRAGCLHLACHGQFDPQRPFDAALLLGADKLRAVEFFHTPLAARIVVLSACDAGRRAAQLDGVLAAFDEWLGLFVPLFYAGARCVVASRWPAAADATLRFMDVLHQQLAGGASPAAAHRAACLALRGEAPVLWAQWLPAGITLPG